MTSPEKLYKFHVENLRAVSRGLEHVVAVAREAIARRRDTVMPSDIRLFLLLLGAWSECRLMKLIYEPNAFSDTDRAFILKKTALRRWHAAVERAFRRHYRISRAALRPPALPSTAHGRLGVLKDALDADLGAVITMRNKLAHGQWAYPLNESLDNVAQTQMDALRTENLLSLKQKWALLDAVCASVHDLAISLPTFNRDWDKHFRHVEQIRINIRQKSYSAWAAQLRAKYERGQSARRPPREVANKA